MKKTIVLLATILLLSATWAKTENCRIIQACNQIKAKEPDTQWRMARMEEFNTKHHFKNY